MGSVETRAVAEDLSHRVPYLVRGHGRGRSRFVLVVAMN